MDVVWLLFVFRFALSDRYTKARKKGDEMLKEAFNMAYLWAMLRPAQLLETEVREQANTS